MVGWKVPSAREDLLRIPDSTTWSLRALDKLFMLEGPAASCVQGR